VKIVLDSNILAAQVLSLDYSDTAAQKLQQWIEQDAELFIPALGLYGAITQSGLGTLPTALNRT
jgi:hypothetical protein